MKIKHPYLLSNLLVFLFVGLLSNSIAQPTTVTFNYTGAVQTWTVPNCVTQITINLKGGKGGGANGGNGGQVTGLMTVTPGQVLQINVGGLGGTPAGGWNGGGNSWPGIVPYNTGGGGGGASDIRVAPYALANRFAVAAGGGGRNGGTATYTAAGGAGGGSFGVNGAGSIFTGTGGGGGLQTMGGTAGPPWGAGQPGVAGSLGLGGNGGNNAANGASGGGGGGGFYGGGGGGGDNCCTGANGGGAGGGGSSLMPPAGTSVANVNTGAGVVTITYTGGGNAILATNTGPYCVGDNIQLNATTGATYSWAGPNNFSSTSQNPTIPSATAAMGGVYTLTFATPQCTSTTTTTVIVNTPINPTFNAIPPICQNGTVPALAASSTNTPTITGTWSPAVISSAVVGTQGYIFTPTPGICADTALFNVTILFNETPTFTQINPMCINSVAPVLPTPSTNVPTQYTGTWTPAVISTTTAGTASYLFTPTVGQCAVQTTMDIVVLNYTNPTFVQVGPICQYTPGIVLPNASTNVPAITGNWNTPNVPTNVPGTFSNFTFTPDPFQCAAQASMTIVINPLIIPQFAQIAQVCEGDVPPVFPLISNNVPGITGTWSAPLIDSVAVGVTTHTFTPNPGQCADTSTMDITVIASVPPSFLSDSLTGCNPLTATLSTVPVVNATYTWLWNGTPIGSGSNLTYMFTSAGCHDITLEYNLQGCIESTTYNGYICMENYPAASFTSNPNVLSSTNETVEFTNTTVGGTTYLWNFGDGTSGTEFSPSHPYIGIMENQLVSLTAYSPLGCPNLFELTLVLMDDPIFYVPNTFTPDQDEHNQTWFPIFTTGFDPFKFNLYIFDRWGEMIWESHDAKGEWDGTYGPDALDVPAGIYNWKIQYAAKDTDSKTVVTGQINLIR